MDPRQTQKISTPYRPRMNTASSPIGTPIREDPNFKSIGMTTSENLNIIARPVTRQEFGLVGVRSNLQGHERICYDKNYFLTQLVNKSNEMAREIEKFAKQMEEINRDNRAFSTLEKKSELLTKEVSNLKGDLVDYNLTFDKLRSGDQPEDIQNMHEHIKRSNERRRAQLDELFIERKMQEDQIQSLEAELNIFHQAVEHRLCELDPEQREDFESLIKENRQLITNINVLRNGLDELNASITQANRNLQMDDKKLKYNILKEQVQILEKKKEELEIQTKQNKLSFPEVREILLKKVKEDNAFILEVDKKKKDAIKTIENYDKKLKEMKIHLAEQKSEEQEKQKIEVLHRKDEEMTKFMDYFDENRKEELQTISRFEHDIVEALEKASETLITEAELSKNGHSFNRDDLANLNHRISEFDEFEQLKDRVITETQSLQEKLAKMEDEIKTKFNKIIEYRKQSEEKRVNLLRSKEAMVQQLNKTKQELTSVGLDLERRKNKLSLHDQYKDLSALEKVFGQNEGKIYTLRTFIESKVLEMNYNKLASECNNVMDTLNKVLLSKHL